MDLLRAFAFLLACASALFALASIGGAFSDRLDVLTHFTPFYLVGGIAALTLALICGAGQGWREGLFFSVIAIAVPAAMMAPDLLAAVIAPRAAPSGQVLKIIQFNLWSENRDPAGTAAWIARQDADVVVVEEAVDGGALVPAALAHLYPYQTRCTPRPACTTLILSKVPPTSAGAFPSPDYDSLHSGAWASFGAGEAAYTVVGTHLTWPFPPGLQRAQAQRLVTDLAPLDKRSLVLAGDFNSTPWSFTLRRLDAGLGLIRRTHAVFSWPARTYGHRHRLVTPFPLLPIDHVFAGQGWKTVSVRRGPRLGSDHFPVVVVLARP
ncbi:MAG: endonuclease/exonuclease/phosphatase family protein [Caulobacteraceae bacterium]